MKNTKKAYEKHDIMFWLGLPYAILGGVFVVIGLVAGVQLGEWLFTVCFSGIGLIFLVLGMVFLSRERKKRQTAKRLFEAGRYIWGEVVDLVPNYNVRVNNRHPYVAKVRYVDTAGVVHIFTSGNLYRYPDFSMMHRQVKIYVEDDRYQAYYVDLDEILPEVQEH